MASGRVNTQALETLVCTGCAQEQPRDSFYVDGRGYRVKRCKTCTKAHNLEWRRSNPDRVRAIQRRYRYGTDGTEFADVCVICGSVDDLHIDHDHVTNQVRGKLCGPCNRGLGLFKDDPQRLRSAADYMEALSDTR